MKITMLGSGAWGTALANLLCENGHQVTLWSRSADKAAAMEESRVNPRLQGVPLHPSLHISSSLQTVGESEMVVFATPLYYCGMSAQLKTLVDRFCAINSSITRKHMKSALLSAAWNADSWTFEALEAHYRTLVRYLDLDDQGAVLGRGCGTLSMTKRSRYPKLAYELGRRL